MDIKNVIKGLTMCTEKAVPNCFRCPYSCHCEEGDTWVIKDDALELLKEQQQQIWEFQDQVEYLTDKLKEQEERIKVLESLRRIEQEGR